MTEGFFQTRSRLAGKRAESPPPAGKPMTVTQLTRQIERAIKSGVPAAVSVQGEVSNYRPQRGGSGHLYFTLKDATAGPTRAACGQRPGRHVYQDDPPPRGIA
jgi:hypothetical protein